MATFKKQRQDPNSPVERLDLRIPIHKLDEEHRIAFGYASVVVDKAGNIVVDHDDDIIPVRDLEEAAYKYAKESRRTTDMHDKSEFGAEYRGNLDADLVEIAVITPEKLKAMDIDFSAAPTGLWVGYQFNDGEQWEFVKKNRPEFSIGVEGIREPLEDFSA